MKHPSDRCQTCGEFIGWSGRLLPFHKCKKNTFKPNYNTKAVLVEEQQRMAQRILDLEALLERQTVLLERQTTRIVDLQTHIDNFDRDDR